MKTAASEIDIWEKLLNGCDEPVAQGSCYFGCNEQEVRFWDAFEALQVKAAEIL